ncbi:phytanoyl-CoA dioxygenase family protein [Pseudoteredinibacter isoporae]|uniref:Phytanoyl-CoA dioxygenase n=1 Tax=Pseudoteredinibacter isoporae TaxID=570281 RepID=A0A7X0JQ59_9GAMM|nr:phytanoyl-CoA dioxygenase family protein [Pseudoteredinibacter isoporae]MBB6520258.1 hypothetical protein [Pseudoteredinibacter isoporae]NHO85830.1 phytanoyl-CoA dioxygenase family protein [Pseudoteredinibacter isoporae]NIB25718.1 phytanoyl-CoA dioxygenase family protein [Pseudoteredinibacter isoporae]
MSTLNPAQVEQYKAQGFICPVDILSPEEARVSRAQLEAMEELQGKPMDRIQCNKTYLLYDWADELVHHPKVLDAVEALIGPDILCYMTNLFTKEAGTGSYVSMHQDAAYWGVDADDVVTAWIALSPATAESGVMKVEPGSHTRERSQVNTYAKDNLLTRGQAIPDAELEPEKQVYMELEPGQMSLHHFMLVHGSDPNQSDDRRIGLAVRYVAATAKKIGKPESALLVRGENKGNFLMETRTKGLGKGARTVEHIRALRRQLHNIFEPNEQADWKERLRLRITKTAAIGLSYIKEFSAKLAS